MYNERRNEGKGREKQRLKRRGRERWKLTVMCPVLEVAICSYVRSERACCELKLGTEQLYEKTKKKGIRGELGKFVC